MPINYAIEYPRLQERCANLEAERDAALQERDLAEHRQGEAMAERDALLEQLSDARIKVELLRPDAERYRWLRDAGNWSWSPLGKRFGIDGGDIDAAINAAMAKEKA